MSNWQRDARPIWCRQCEHYTLKGNYPFESTNCDKCGEDLYGVNSAKTERASERNKSLSDENVCRDERNTGDDALR